MVWDSGGVGLRKEGVVTCRWVSLYDRSGDNRDIGWYEDFRARGLVTGTAGISIGVEIHRLRDLVAVGTSIGLGIHQLRDLETIGLLADRD